MSDALLSSLNEVVETKTGTPKKKSSAMGENGLPKGFIDLDEVTLDSNPELFMRNSSKVMI